MTNNLYQKLKIYSDSTSTEIFVLIVNTTQGEDVARYATDLGHQWEIGQKGKDNGVVLLIALGDRKMNIAAGYGVEHLLTDALSRRIIEKEIKPYFKKGAIYNGIDAGTTRFNVPNFNNGSFLRGFGGNSAAIGTQQDENIKTHTHNFTYQVPTNIGSGSSARACEVATSGYATTIATQSNTAGSPDETRPKNFAILYYIKY